MFPRGERLRSTRWWHCGASSINFRTADQVRCSKVGAYREAVKEHSPGLPRFAATLGSQVNEESQPQRGCDSFLIRLVERRNSLRDATPLGLDAMQTISPG